MFIGIFLKLLMAYLVRHCGFMDTLSHLSADYADKGRWKTSLLVLICENLRHLRIKVFAVSCVI